MKTSTENTSCSSTGSHWTARIPRGSAASEALRHGGVAVTARHYIENKQRSVLGFGHLLKNEARTVVPG